MCGMPYGDILLLEAEFFRSAGVLGGWGGIELQTRILIMWG